MTTIAIQERLILIARNRLQNRPGAFEQFQHTLENSVQGVAMTTAAHAMPYVWGVAEQMGNTGATERIQTHLLGIVDHWAESQPLPPAVEPLPGAAPPKAAAVPFTKAALIKAHEHEWPTIARDMDDAHANGLSAAKAGKRGWKEAEALEWARAKGKLQTTSKPAASLAQAMHNMGSLPGRKHTLM